ncbi:MAG: cyclic nucleotide-binding domain-containing protein [Betaproteobacteria bacterium]|nr:cyclic nucleotide-binding domain-containing protein [Betaproteobacteria bacterium]
MHRTEIDAGVAAAGHESGRAKAHHLLTREESASGGVTLRTGLVLLIVFSVVAAILKSVPEIGRLHAGALELVLLLTTFGFAVEYLVRVWTAPEDPGASGALRARLRYVFSLPGLVDLIAGIPFALAPHIGLALDWLDIVPIFKLLRYTEAFQFMVEAVYSERRVLGSAAVLMLALLVFQSSAVYYLERDAQPDRFGSIPDAMWWGIVTLTTVGYGDVTPITPWGKVMGGLTAILGVCMFAIPVGIIASAFVEAVRRREFLVTWNLIASVPLFQNLDAVRIAALAATLRPRRAERGERLIRKGDRADSMYFIVSGEVEVDTATGVPPWRMKPGEFFGEVALIADRPRTANITAATRCRLLVLSKLDFDGFMTAHPEIAQAVRIAARKRLGEVEAADRQ